jgi:two-component system nitrogen regulation response regulator GlnG
MPSDATRTVERQARPIGRWRIAVTSGVARGATRDVGGGSVRIGSAPDNDLVVADPTVSRYHVELVAGDGTIAARDLGSKNGLVYQGARVDTVDLPARGGTLQIGDVELLVIPADEAEDAAAPLRDRLARLRGSHPLMCELYDKITRVANGTATVLITGETGVGKELVAEAVHEYSPRRRGQFVVVDCGGLPPTLIESELFGHVRGAFTGADRDHPGAFRSAHGGTLFIDEVGELPLELQPRLLRALESHQIKPVGEARSIDVDLRVIAATNRDLAAEVAAGRFRADLFYRLSVVHLAVPPLRDRETDIAVLADGFLADAGRGALTPATRALLAAYHWPGNVRQLRNVIERAVALAKGDAIEVKPDELEQPAALTSPSTLLSLPYKAAKEEMIARFTRDYIERLVARHAGNVSAAARAAGIDRNWVVALARRHHVRVRE